MTKHELGCPKEADPRNETCDCARLRQLPVLTFSDTFSEGWILQHKTRIPLHELVAAIREQYGIRERKVCHNTLPMVLSQGNRARRRKDARSRR